MLKARLKLKRKIDFNSFAAVSVMLTQFLYVSATNLLHFKYSGALGSLIAAMCLIIAFFQEPVTVVRLTNEKKYKYGIIAFVFALYIISRVACKDEMALGISHFVAFVIFPCMVISDKIKPYKIITYCLYLTPVIFLMESAFFATKGMENQMQMGNSYAVMPIALASIVHLKYYSKSSTWYTKICYIFGAILTLRLLMLSVRGASLTILIALLLICVIQYDEKGNFKKATTKTTLIITSVVILSIIVVNNLDNIANALLSFCNRTTTTVPAFIKKTIAAMQRHDVTSGRREVYAYTVRMIKDKPFFGHGITTFKFYNGVYAYPHNCFLQLLFDVGFVGGSVEIVAVGLFIYRMIRYGKDLSKDAFLFGMVLLLSTFPMLLFSNDVWESPPFWMCLMYGIFLTPKFLTDKNIKSE